MKKFFLCFGIVFFFLINTCYAYDITVGACQDASCDVVDIPSAGDKYYIPSGKVLRLSTSWITLFQDEQDLSYVSVEYSMSSGVTKGNYSFNASPLYTVSTISNGYKITAPETFPEDHEWSPSFIIDFSLPTNNSSTNSSFYRIDLTTKAYNKAGQQITNQKTTFDVSVLAANPKVYDNDASLSGIDINCGTLTPPFSNDAMFFSVQCEAASITINLKPRSSKAKVYYNGRNVNEKEYDDGEKEISGPQTYPLEYGSNTFAFSSASEKYLNMSNIPEGTYLYDSWPDFSDLGGGLYAIVVTRPDNRSTVNTLKSLTISDVQIDFKPELKFYTGTVKNEVESINISSTLTDSKSSYVKGFGNRTEKLNEGTNTFYIKVTAENGAESVYTLTIEREKSANNKLKEIDVNGKIISVKDDKLKYEINVDNNVTTAEVKATPELEGVAVEISEIPPLVEGDNEVTITVTAPNGEKKIYVVNIKRDSLVSSNSLLKKLEVKGYELDFDYHTREYTLKIKDEQELEITAEADHKKAKVLITGNKNLVNGSVIKIKVTAEDGSESSYQITIEKEAKKINPLIIIIPLALILLIGGSIAFTIISNNKKKKKTVATPLGDLKILDVEEEPATPTATPTEPTAAPETAPSAPETPAVETPSAAPETPAEPTSTPEVAPATPPVEEAPAPVESAAVEPAPIETPVEEAAIPAIEPNPFVEKPAEPAPEAFEEINAIEQTPPNPTEDNVEVLNIETNPSTSEEFNNPDIKQN